MLLRNYWCIYNQACINKDLWDQYIIQTEMQKIKIAYMYSREMTIMDPMDIRFNLK